jgi:hypothetical protein
VGLERFLGRGLRGLVVAGNLAASPLVSLVSDGLTDLGGFGTRCAGDPQT